MATPSTLTVKPDSTALGSPSSTISDWRGRAAWSREDLLPALGGLMFGLAFAPVNFVPLAFVSLIPLLMYLDGPVSISRIIRASFIFPIAFYGFTLNWLAGMAGFSWLAVPGYMIIVFVYCCGFFVFTLPVVLLKRFLHLPFIATAPFAWVACERLRGYGDLAFPWSNLGCSLTRFPFLLQFADIVGVFGVSFWLIVLNVLAFEIFNAWRVRTNGATFATVNSAGVHTAEGISETSPEGATYVSPGRKSWVSSLMRPSPGGTAQTKGMVRYAIAWIAVFGLVMAYDALRWFGGVGEPIGYKQVSVIQPNIAQKIKWDEHYSRQILDHVFSMNAAAITPSTDLVIWPETAIPYYIDEQRRFRLTEMGQLPRGNAHIIAGLLTSKQDSNGQLHYFNAAGLFNSQGDLLGLYKKIYLVPGSEEYPFRNLLGFTRSFFNIQDVSYGAMDPGTEFKVFQIPGAKFSVMICYESVYPQLTRAFRRAGANFIVNITNDAWFGHSFAAYQHASFLVLRAIENRVAIVRCGNTGISGFVDPLGRWHQKTQIFTETTISQPVPVTNAVTFYARFGDLIVYVSYAALGMYVLVALREKFKNNNRRVG